MRGHNRILFAAARSERRLAEIAERNIVAVVGTRCPDTAMIAFLYGLAS
jgi:hypothetical protein